MSEVLGNLLDSLKGIGTELTHEVTLGEFVFLLRPLSSQKEIEVYLRAEGLSQGEQKPGESSVFRITPSYVHTVRQEIVASAISQINGMELDHCGVVSDSAGQKIEVSKYLQDLVASWPSEVVEYFFVEYNRLQIKVSEKYGFKLTHRAMMSALDEILRVGAELATGTQSLFDTEDAQPEAEEDQEEDQGGSDGEVPQSEDIAPEGVPVQDRSSAVSEDGAEAG